MSSQTQTADIGMGSASLDRPLFDESIEAIEHTILGEHRVIFRHVEPSSLLEELRIIAARNSTGDQTLVACSRKFALFVQAFAPYFNVLSICGQVKAEWPGCLWGLVHLVFQVASNHVLFLEKIADMFEVIANVLPPYHHIYAICKRRMDNLQVDTEDEHLATLMSYAYADITRLCLDLYGTFFRNISGPALRHMAFNSTRVAQWRPIDSRFAQLEGRLAHHRKWLEKETEGPNQDYAEVDGNRKRYVRFLQRQADSNVNGNGELEEQRLAKRMRRVAIVQRWLSNSSQIQRIRIEEQRTGHLGSCNWFLDLPKYRNWKKKRFDQNHANSTSALQGDWHDRVLFIQAAAGFGKTFLAHAAKDDLIAEADDPENDGEPPSTAYFHIDANHSEPKHPDDVFRQLSLQLLYAHRHDRATLDVVCLLLRKTSFQETATANEVLEVLSILLRQHPTFLVIDGVEGCSDEKELLSSLAQLCQKADVRAIILSRPALKIPLEYQKWASDAPHILHLDMRHNSDAIERFVGQNLSQMADLGYFGISMDRKLISHVAQRSEGSFLWASLLLTYLRSRALSPNERQYILLHVQSLQGLEALYNHVFETLKHRPAHERRVTADVVRWLSFPVHRLCTSALRTALTSSIDMAENEDSFPTDVLQALPQLTGGLVEVSEDRVFFSHPSVREYLQSPVSQGSEFSLCDESSVHAHLTARCLSYLAHDVPQRPLGGLSPRIRPMMPNLPTGSGASYRTSRSGDSGYKSLSSSDGDNALPHPVISPSRNNASTASILTIPFDTNLPFLRYASLCWPIHLSRALAPTHIIHPYVTPSPSPFQAVPYLPALSAFLASRLAVTAWVEASFRYNLPPTLTRLVGPLADLKGEIPPATIEGRELRLVLGALNVLSEKLMDLKRGFATSLRENPSLIWQMEEDGEDYWPVWDGSLGMPR